VDYFLSLSTGATLVVRVNGVDYTATLTGEPSSSFDGIFNRLRADVTWVGGNYSNSTPMNGLVASETVFLVDNPNGIESLDEISRVYVNGVAKDLFPSKYSAITGFSTDLDNTISVGDAVTAFGSPVSLVGTDRTGDDSYILGFDSEGKFWATGSLPIAAPKVTPLVENLVNSFSGSHSSIVSSPAYTVTRSGPGRTGVGLLQVVYRVEVYGGNAAKAAPYLKAQMSSDGGTTWSNITTGPSGSGLSIIATSSLLSSAKLEDSKTLAVTNLPDGNLSFRFIGGQYTGNAFNTVNFVIHEASFIEF